MYIYIGIASQFEGGEDSIVKVGKKISLEKNPV